MDGWPSSALVETRLVGCAGHGYQIFEAHAFSTNGNSDTIINATPLKRIVVVGFIIETHKTDFIGYFEDSNVGRLMGDIHCPLQSNFSALVVREYARVSFEYDLRFNNQGGDNGYVTVWYYLRNN